MRLNKVLLIGRLTAAPEYRLIGETALTTFTLAVNESYKKDDEWIDKVTFIDCKVWGKQAERLAELEKGEEVLVEGKLEQERWEKDGKNYSKIVVSVIRCSRTGKRKKEEKSENEYSDIDF